MRLLKLSGFDGPSLWLPVRSVRLVVATDAGEGPAEIERSRLAHHILAAVPRLRESGLDAHNRELAGDLTQQRALTAGELIARLALTLQREAGAEVAQWSTVLEEDRESLSFACLDLATGVLAAKLSCAVVGNALRAASPVATAPLGPEMLEAALASFHQLAWPGRKIFSFPPIIAAAQRLGIPVRREWPSGGDLLLGQGHRLRRGRSARTGHTSYTAVTLARDKHRCAQLLRSMGLPAPHGGLVTTADEAVAAARALGYPVVLKPNNLDQGRGVEVGLKDEAAVRGAFDRVVTHGTAILLESFIPGEEHRILVIGGRALAVVRRRPARVIGDGHSTIEQLVAEANRGSKRAMGFQRFSLPVLLDDKAIAVLAEQQLHPQCVPPVGMTCYLRRNSNVSEGGTADDMTEETHPDNLALVERAARIVGLDLAGVDFLTRDITRSWREVGGAICEVNDNPGFGLHHMGKPPKADLGAAYLALLFGDGRPARIPIVAIVEPEEASVGRALKALLQVGGVKSGLATSREIFVGEAYSRPIDSFPDSPSLLLCDPEIEAAVFSLTLRSIAEQGLPFDLCDLSMTLLPSGGIADESERRALALLQVHTKHHALSRQPALDQRDSSAAAETLLQAMRHSVPSLQAPATANAIS